MIQSLVPDSQRLQKHLNSLAEFTECDEIVLFEHSTFLVARQLGQHAAAGPVSLREDQQSHQAVQVGDNVRVDWMSHGKEVSQFVRGIHDSRWRADYLHEAVHGVHVDDGRVIAVSYE